MTTVLLVGNDSVLMHKLQEVFPDASFASGDDLLVYRELPECDVLVLLAESGAPATADYEAHAPSLRMAEYAVLTAISRGVPIVFASSVWATVHHLNPYACVKRCIEQMVDTHGGESVRVGWVGYTREGLAEASLPEGMAWSDEKLKAAFEEAVERVSSSMEAAKIESDLRAAAAWQINQWRSANV